MDDFSTPRTKYSQKWFTGSLFLYIVVQPVIVKSFEAIEAIETFEAFEAFENDESMS